MAWRECLLFVKIQHAINKHVTNNAQLPAYISIADNRKTNCKMSKWQTDTNPGKLTLVLVKSRAGKVNEVGKER